MRWLLRRLRHVRAPFARGDYERDMTDEMRFHIEMETEDLMRRGMTRTGAHRTALAMFGGMTRLKEEGHVMRGSNWFGDLVQDLRYTKRNLLHNRGYAAAAILTLALGIGATTTIFGVVNGVLLKPMAYRAPDKLFLLWDDLHWVGVNEAWVTGPEIVKLRAETKTFAGFAAVRGGSMGMSAEGGEPEQLSVLLASSNFFDLLGMRPARGRGFAAGEDRVGAPLVTVISDGLWKRRFGADPAIVGKTVALDGKPATVVGVLPPRASFALQTSLGSPSTVDMYIPLQVDLAADGLDSHRYGVLARVRDDVPTSRALAELDALSRRYDKDFYKHDFRFVPLAVRERLVREVRPALLALMAAVGLLILIMSANLATLALARASRREREFAIRKALGAARSRITRQVLTETVIIALVGAIGGVILARWGIEGLLALAPAGLPRRAEIGVDFVVVAFTLGVGLLVGLAMGLAPVVHSMRRDISAVMREKTTTGGGYRTRGLLVLVQVALSLVLLAGTGLLLTSFARLTTVDPGFNASRALAISLRANPAKYPSERVAAFASSYIERLAALPGVRIVGATTSPPLSADADQFNVGFPDSPINNGDGRHDSLLIDYAIATQNYFAAMGAPILRGRDFSPADMAKAPPVVIIDEALERHFFPAGSAIGKTLRIYGDTDATVIGVVRQIRLYNIQEENRPQLYRPENQVPARSLTYVVRANTDDLSALSAGARQALKSIDPAQPIIRLQPMTAVVAQSLAERRLVLVLVAGFATTALLLAALGVYGVTSAAVAQRTRELGIRMALGARGGSVVRLMLVQPLRLVALGLIVGLAGSLAGARLIEKLLYGVTPGDPLTLGVVALVLAGVALLAGYLPARRATRVDPASVLRAE